MRVIVVVECRTLWGEPEGDNDCIMSPSGSPHNVMVLHTMSTLRLCTTVES